MALCTLWIADPWFKKRHITMCVCGDWGYMCWGRVCMRVCSYILQVRHVGWPRQRGIAFQLLIARVIKADSYQSTIHA